MTVQTAACTPNACTPARKPAAVAAIAAAAAHFAAKTAEAFAVLHDAHWRAPWDAPGQR